VRVCAGRGKRASATKSIRIPKSEKEIRVGRDVVSFGFWDTEADSFGNTRRALHDA